MTSSSGEHQGLFSSVNRLVHTAISLIETRIELLAVEIKEEKLRIIQLLLWASAAIFLAAITLVMLTITLIFAVWDQPSARVPALIVISLLYVAATAFAAYRLDKLLRGSPLPFSDTLNQLKKDSACLPK